MLFFERSMYWELSHVSFSTYYMDLNQHEYDLKRLGVKNYVCPCLCICMDSNIRGQFTRPSALLCMQHYWEIANTGWLGIRTRIPADCCFSELAL